MTEEKFEYKSEVKNINQYLDYLDFSRTNGLECAWKCYLMKNDSFSSSYASLLYDTSSYDVSSYTRNYPKYDTLDFSWKFNWDKLKKKGIDRLSGYIIVKPSDERTYYYEWFNEQKIDVDMVEPDDCIKKKIKTLESIGSYRAMFEYSLTPHYTQIEKVEEKDWSSEQQDIIAPIKETDVDEEDIHINKEKHSTDSKEMLTPSEQNDATLVVDGKEIRVSKVFLSCHSEFFSNLFSLNDNDGKVNVIPIEAISYDDFKLLLGTISPNPVFPNDETMEKLLELATRFKVPFVIDQCEYYLLHVSKVGNEKKMLMAEKYKIRSVLERSIYEINTLKKATKWKQSPEYTQISDETKKRVLKKFS